MKRPTLKAEKRKIFGKKVKKLRLEGILPGNLYGKKVKSQALQVKLVDFIKIYKEIGETGLLELTIGKSDQTRPVLIHNVQVHPASDDFLHADFQQVILKEKIKAEIPLEIIGESPAISQKKGILIQPLKRVEVEALPTDLPERVKIDISELAEVNQEIKVGDLPIDKKVTLLTDKNLVVAKIGPLEEEEVEEKKKEVKAPEEKQKEGAKEEEGQKKEEKK